MFPLPRDVDSTFIWPPGFSTVVAPSKVNAPATSPSLHSAYFSLRHQTVPKNLLDSS
jgi:hypothetical protein